MAVPAARRSMKQLWQQACTEIPEVVGTTALGIVGIGLALAGLSKFVKSDGDNRRYKLAYVIMRPDDPRAAKIRKA